MPPVAVAIVWRSQRRRLFWGNCPWGWWRQPLCGDLWHLTGDLSLISPSSSSSISYFLLPNALPRYLSDDEESVILIADLSSTSLLPPIRPPCHCQVMQPMGGIAMRALRSLWSTRYTIDGASSVVPPNRFCLCAKEGHLYPSACIPTVCLFIRVLMHQWVFLNIRHSYHLSAGRSVSVRFIVRLLVFVSSSSGVKWYQSDCVSVIAASQWRHWFNMAPGIRFLIMWQIAYQWKPQTDKQTHTKTQRHSDIEPGRQTWTRSHADMFRDTQAHIQKDIHTDRDCSQSAPVANGREPERERVDSLQLNNCRLALHNYISLIACIWKTFVLYSVWQKSRHAGFISRTASDQSQNND